MPKTTGRAAPAKTGRIARAGQQDDKADGWYATQRPRPPRRRRRRRQRRPRPAHRQEGAGQEDGTTEEGRGRQEAGGEEAERQPPKKAAAVKAAPAKKAAVKKGPVVLDKFLEGQRAALLEERATYTHQAESLQAEADLLAAEREPGDVQFDEESGEGDTLAVERERDLALSAQARAAVDEIDAALAKIADGTLRHVRAVRQVDPEGAPACDPVRGAVRPVQEHGARQAVRAEPGVEDPAHPFGHRGRGPRGRRSINSRSGGRCATLDDARHRPVLDAAVPSRSQQRCRVQPCRAVAAVSSRSWPSPSSWR